VRFNRVTLANRTKIIAALKATPNVSVVFKSLGKRIGVSYGTIWNIAEGVGIERVRFTRQRAKPLLSAKTRMRVAAALNANPNVLLVARKLRVKSHRVRIVAQEEGIELSNGRAAYQKKCAKIIEALKINSNASQVAKDLGFGYHVVWRLARRAEIPLSRSGKGIRKPPLKLPPLRHPVKGGVALEGPHVARE